MPQNGASGPWPHINATGLHDDVIRTLAANRTNQPFDISPLLGTSRRRKHLFDVHGFYLINEMLPEFSIAIAQ